MTQRRQVLGHVALFVVALALATYVVYARGFAPLARESKSLNQRMKVTRQKLTELPEKAETLARLRGEYAQTAETLGEFESTVTRGDGIPYFLRDLENTSSASGVTVVSLSTGPLAGSGPYAELPVTIQVSGSYPQVKAFLSELFSLGRAMSVRTMRLSAPRGAEVAGGTPALDATFVLVLYVMPEGGRKE